MINIEVKIVGEDASTDISSDLSAAIEGVLDKNGLTQRSVTIDDGAITGSDSDVLTVERDGFNTLLETAEAGTSLGLEMVALASEIGPESYEKFCALLAKHHNANCAPLYRWAKQKLK